VRIHYHRRLHRLRLLDTAKGTICLESSSRGPKKRSGTAQIEVVEEKPKPGFETEIYDVYVWTGSESNRIPFAWITVRW